MIRRDTSNRVERVLQGMVLLILLFVAVDTVAPVASPPSYSKLVVDRNGAFLHAFLSSDDKWRMEIGLEEISPKLIKALRIKEDRYFYFHPGFNPASILRAAWQNTKKGYRTSGASTITMQVVRLLEPRPRTAVSKFTEIFRAMQLEWRYSKKEILQIYVNLLPYGGNIEGLKAASLIYLDKFPEQLSLAEIAALSVIPNDPERYRFDRDAAALQARRDNLLRYFARRKAFTEDEITEALAQPLGGQRRNLPRRAPHFSRRVARYSKAHTIHTTLDLQVQAEAEALASSYIRQLRYAAIYNLAVLIVDNRDRSVAAYVGSQDFADAEHAGQVDGVTALRSPGSTLKPLIYGLAFDDGLLTPKTVLTDLPVFYGGYQPENYDEEYRGTVTVEYALAHSLNVPAVKCLEQLGIDRFINALAGAGFRWIDQRRKSLGLSLALGGCGVRLEELTNLYASLAAHGTWKPLKFEMDERETVGDTLLSEASSYLVHGILTQLERPDLPRESEHARNVPKVAWKTGTSYGRRDAWSIGYSERYTVGVWVGNFTGEGVPELSGTSAATPLMLRLFTALEGTVPAQGYRKPETVQLRYVCPVSGKPPAPFCDEQILDHYLPGISPSGTCEHLTEVWTDAGSTYSYCAYCLGEQPVVKAWFENLPADLISFRREEHIPYRPIPPHNPDCSRIFPDHPPEIIHPTGLATYYIDTTESDAILFRARAGNDVERVFWYINGAFSGSAGKDEPVFRQVPAGTSVVTCTDDKGRSVSVQIAVQYL